MLNNKCYTVNISELGQIKMPSKVCETLNLKSRADTFISNENGTIVLRNFARGEWVITRKLDDLGRVVLPIAVRNVLEIHGPDSVALTLTNDGVIISKNKGDFPHE